MVSFRKSTSQRDDNANIVLVDNRTRRTEMTFRFRGKDLVSDGGDGDKKYANYLPFDKTAITSTTTTVIETAISHPRDTRQIGYGFPKEVRAWLNRRASIRSPTDEMNSVWNRFCESKNAHPADKNQLCLLMDSTSNTDLLVMSGTRGESAITTVFRLFHTIRCWVEM